MVLADILGEHVVNVSERDQGKSASPFKGFIAVLLSLMAMFIGGMVIGFNKYN